LSNLFTPAGIVWTIASSITQPIFQGGTLTARRKAAQAAQAALEVAAAQCSSTVNTAFQNVANALMAIEREAETLPRRVRVSRLRVLSCQSPALP
jgi:outer membrane protein TolC